jgi:hypothetical protein
VSALAFVGKLNPDGANTRDAVNVPVAVNEAANEVAAYVRVRVARYAVTASRDDRHCIESVELVEFIANPTVVPANGPTIDGSNETVYAVSVAVPDGTVPTTDPNDGLVFHVVDWDHADVVNWIDCDTADPAVADVVVRNAKSTLVNVSPAGAAGRMNSNNDHKFDPECRDVVNAGAVVGVEELT